MFYRQDTNGYERVLEGVDEKVAQTFSLHI